MGFFKEYGNLPDRWPKTENGELVAPAFLIHCDCIDYSDEIRINMLEAYGIPCIKMYPGDGSLGHVILGMSGNGTDIYVPETMLKDALALCREESSDELV